MYRGLSKKTTIYCEKESCDHLCGLFHKRPGTSPGQRRKGHKNIKLQLPKSVPSFTSLTPSISPQDVGPNSLLNVRIGSVEPPSPISMSSTVTLDDIIASARRKISQEYDEIRLPSPVFLDEVPSERSSSWAGITQSELGDNSFVQHLVDSSDDELWMNGEPPTMAADEEQEDFDDLLKATKPPGDHYSNPLLRGSDHLSKRRHLNNSDNEDASSVDLSVADISGSQLSLNRIVSMHASLSNSPNRIEYEADL